jgi:hypothetical protein
VTTNLVLTGPNRPKTWHSRSITLGDSQSRKGGIGVRSHLLLMDNGPQFAGWSGTSNGRMVCVAPIEITQDAAARQSMRETVKRSGGDCEGCRGCPVWQIGA